MNVRRCSGNPEPTNTTQLEDRERQDGGSEGNPQPEKVAVVLFDVIDTTLDKVVTTTAVAAEAFVYVVAQVVGIWPVFLDGP